MTRDNQKSNWWKAMIAKHGSEEAVSAFMSKSANKANRANSGWFQRLTPEERSEISRKAANARWGKKDAKKQ